MEEFIKRKGGKEKRIYRPNPDTMSISFDNFVSQSLVLNGIFGRGERGSNLRFLRKKGMPMCSPGGGEDGE